MADDISVRLNGDNSSYRSSMSDAVDATGKAVSRIEEHLVGTRAIATAVGTALGLHLSEIADNVARFVVGLSKDEEAALKHLEEVGAQTTEVLKQQLASRNSQDQTLTAAQTEMARLLKEQAVLQDQINDGSKTYVSNIRSTETTWENITDGLSFTKATTQAITDLEANKLAIQKQASVIQSAQAAVAKTDLETDQKKVQIAQDGLSDSDKLQNFLIQQRDLEQQILNFKGAGKDLDILKNEHLQNEGAINAIYAAQKKKAQADDLQYDEENEKYVKDNLDVLIAEATVYSGRTDAQNNLLALYQLEITLKNNLVILEGLLATNVVDRSLKEKDQIQSLLTQDAALKQQISDKQALIKATADQASAEQKVTDGLNEQIQATQILISQKSNGQDDTQLTDAELQAKISTLKSEIFNTNASAGGNQWLKDILTNNEQGLADAAQQELQKRTTFRTQVSALGEGAALSLYSPFDQKQLQGYLGSADNGKAVADGITAISQQLSNSGLFPTGTVVVPPTR